MNWIERFLTAIATHKADLSAHTRDIFELVETGTYLPSPLMARYDMNVSVALVADTLYAIPYPIIRARTPAEIAIEVQAGVAGNLRIGIHKDNGSVYPGARVTNGGVVDVTALGLKIVAYTTQLTKGLYWITFISDVAPTIWCTYDYLSLVGNAATIQAHFIGWKIADAYGNLPDPFPAGAVALLELFAAGFKFTSND